MLDEAEMAALIEQMPVGLSGTILHSWGGGEYLVTKRMIFQVNNR